MVRRRRRGAAAADGVPAEGLLTEGETVASDQFSFLPPGVPAGGTGGLQGVGPGGACLEQAGQCRGICAARRSASLAGRSLWHLRLAMVA